MRRIWLHNVGLFEVIPNSGNGSCLFQAISQALTFSQKYHYKIRCAIVEHMTSKKWTEKLNELPGFWKHKIVTNWLSKERSSLTQQERQTHSSNMFIKLLQFCVFKWLQKFVESKRNRKYNRIKGLLQRKSKPYPKHSDDFKFVFRKFMSQVDEPATRFELEAAADKFRFHFDYLQTIPITSKNLPHTQIKLPSSIQDDILNNNVPADTADWIETTQDDKNNIKDHISVPVKMSLYQFHSCRTCGCKLPRGSTTFEHYYYLHSPLLANDEKNSKSNSSNKTTVESLSFMESGGGECWHWELLLPIFVRRNPMPLNRRVFGLSYEITESSRNFAYTQWGQKREIPDTVASVIEAFIETNPEIIPPEDPRWPADAVDDYSGCAQTLEDSVYYVNVEEEEKYCSSSRRVVNNRENIIKELDKIQNRIE